MLFILPGSFAARTAAEKSWIIRARDAAVLRIVHEGRGGYIELGGHRYLIEHVEGGRFFIHYPSGNRSPSRDGHLATLEALCAAEPEKWRIERHDRRRERR